ncbi:MAG: 50S ribosomal protein L19 [Patescibacteria group bacterium]
MANKPFTVANIDVEARKKWPILVGSRVRVSQKISEKGKTRLQAFEGLVIAKKHGTEPGATFTVRRVASGVGMEKIFPLYSPMIEKVDRLSLAHVRRSKLYYVREKATKEIARKMKQMNRPGSFVVPDASAIKEE